MKQRVMITVDVEAQPTRASGYHIDRLIYGRFGDEEYGIGRMFDIADRNDIRLTCFLDYAEEHLYGEALLDVGHHIIDRGQDLQVHLHPEFMSAAVFEQAGIKRINDMFVAEVEQACLLIGQAVHAHQRITGQKPIAFRSGGYRYNGAILSELARHGLRFNSGYNPSRQNQPFNVGALKQFQWAEGVIELPISCVPGFRNTRRLFDYNFNSDLLLRGTAEESVRSHEEFLQAFFHRYGDDAVAVLVMHSWSLLNFNDATGYYDTPNPEAVEKFSALLAMLSEKYEVTTTDELAKTDSVKIDRSLAWRRNQFTIGGATYDAASVICDVCGAGPEHFKDYNGSRRRCDVCRSVERQRTFAVLLRSFPEKFDLNGKMMLHISPGDSEKFLFSRQAGLVTKTLDIQETLRTDIVADLCNMPMVADNSFDIVFASQTLSHVSDLNAALREINRVLTDDGIFINYESIYDGRFTEEVVDHAQVTNHYGEERYQKYNIGRFRNFGSLDLDEVFCPLFVREKFDLVDRPSGISVTWNLWRKPARPADMKPVCSICGSAPIQTDKNGNCLSCRSGSRQRALPALMSEVVQPLFEKSREWLTDRPLLAISMQSDERKILSEVFGAFKSASLHGSYGADCESGVDVRNLTRYDDSGFSGVFSCGVFDYFTEHEAALRECFRVTAPGGIFMTHILPYRLLADDQAPVSAATITGRPGYLEYLPKDESYADVRVGRDWFLATMQNIGFEAQAVTVPDAVPGVSSVWFVGVKPVDMAEQAAPVVEYKVDACPVCGDSLNEVDSGQNCKGCESRARLRSMAPLMREYLAPRIKDDPVVNLPLLAFAMTGAEKKFLATVFQNFKSVSLFGNYAADHESGVDMRDLSRYAPDGFSGVFGCLLFDYFQEHEQALRECFRVIAPGGILFTHIAPYRLLDGDRAPEQKGAIKSRAGYFDYLPEKTELPDVKVGRDWFVAAMRRVGFETSIVKVMDAAPGIFSEWFVGFKPGRWEKKLPADLSKPAIAPAATSSQSATRIDTRCTEVFRSVVPLGEKLGVLKFELIEATSGSLVFLEDHSLAAPDGGGQLREIVATNGSREQILVSRDLGATWQQRYAGTAWDSKIRWVFSLADGGRLVRTFSGRMYHFDAGGRLLGEQATGAWHWHGSQGIGQSASGTVMYAEYAPLRDADGVQDLSVWRYRPGAPRQGWHRVLTLPAGVRPPHGELRHFHVCHPHPADPSLWVLASGDIGVHCRLWLSHNDGDTWQEVALDQAGMVGMPEGKYPRLLRFTQFAALPNGDLIWGTDDTADANCAALVCMRLSERPTFFFLGWLGQNCIRNISGFGNDRFLLLSESSDKRDSTTADCILYDATTRLTTRLLLPNLSRKNHSITDSLGSLQLTNEVGFFPAAGAVLMTSDQRGIFRVSIEELAR